MGKIHTMEVNVINCLLTTFFKLFYLVFSRRIKFTGLEQCERRLKNG